METVFLSSVLLELRSVLLRTGRDLVELAKTVEQSRVGASQHLALALLDVEEGCHVGACRYWLRVLCGSRRNPMQLPAVEVLLFDGYYSPREAYRAVVNLDVLPTDRLRLESLTDIWGREVGRADRLYLFRGVEPFDWRRAPIGAAAASLHRRLPLDLTQLVLLEWMAYRPRFAYCPRRRGTAAP